MRQVSVISEACDMLGVMGSVLFAETMTLSLSHTQTHKQKTQLKTITSLVELNRLLTLEKKTSNVPGEVILISVN